jgi:hypothetical protein
MACAYRTFHHGLGRSERSEGRSWFVVVSPHSRLTQADVTPIVTFSSTLILVCFNAISRDAALPTVGKPTRAFFELALRSLEEDGITSKHWSSVGMVSHFTLIPFSAFPSPPLHAPAALPSPPGNLGADLPLTHRSATIGSKTPVSLLGNSVFVGILFGQGSIGREMRRGWRVRRVRRGYSRERLGRSGVGRTLRRRCGRCWANKNEGKLEEQS